MNKQPQTYYAIVSVEKGSLPRDGKEYISIINKDGKEEMIVRINAEVMASMMNVKDTYIEYLSKQQGVVLSVEEWEKVQGAFELIKVRLKNLEIKECDFIIEPMERWLSTTKH